MFERIFGREEPSPLIQSAFDDISAMLQQGEKMLALAAAALLDNETLDVDLDRMDDEIDQREQMVRRSVLEHLSFDPQSDLVASLILVSMVQDAERLGDFARGLGELVDLTQKPRSGPFVDRLREFVGELEPLFAMTRKGFQDDDPDLAAKVVQRYVALKARILDFTRQVAESDLAAADAVVYSAAARILRRVGAHLSNICSSVTQPYHRIRHGDEEA